MIKKLIDMIYRISHKIYIYMKLGEIVWIGINFVKNNRV